MQRQDQTEGKTDKETELSEHFSDRAETVSAALVPSSSLASSEGREFDWLAIGVVLLLAALFAFGARLNAQPSTSLTPAAVLTATGCGLLVTAIRKLHTPWRPGLFEASIGGLFLALFQFMAAMTYPGVFHTLSLASNERLGFLTTWGLIAAFSVVFSMVGAILGHLAFAPLRPLAAKNKASQVFETDEQEQEAPQAVEVQEEGLQHSVDEEQEADERINSAAEAMVVEPEDENDEAAASENVFSSPRHSSISYFVSVLLLGLSPMLVGYVFAAAFDYMLDVYRFFPGPYSTLRLLSALLPWQIPVIINFNSSDPNASIFLLWQLWRIPLFLGNPTAFDIQALEPFVFNAAALSLLLLMQRNAILDSRPARVSWPTYLLLEFLLGFILVLPADLWVFRGLQGLLQEQQVVIQIRTLHILDIPTFILNLMTGPLVCVAIGIILRLWQSKQVQQQTEHSK